MKELSNLFPLQKGETDTSLFFLPDVGGSVLYSLKLIEALGPGPSVFGLRLNRDFDWSRPEETFIKLAEEFAEDLLKSDYPEPYHLIGHSFAGLLAFETARQIKRKGGRVGLLAILDTSIPKHLQINSNTEKLTYVPRLISNTIRRMGYKVLTDGPLETMKVFSHKTVKLLQPHALQSADDKNLRVSAPGYATIDLRPHPEAYRILISKLYKAMTLYSPQLYDGDVVIFKAKVQGFLEANSSHMGWRPFVNGNIKTYNIDGEHLDIIRKKTMVKSVACIIVDLLQGNLLQTQK